MIRGKISSYVGTLILCSVIFPPHLEKSQSPHSGLQGLPWPDHTLRLTSPPSPLAGLTPVAPARGVSLWSSNAPGVTCLRVLDPEGGTFFQIPAHLIHRSLLDFSPMSPQWSLSFKKYIFMAVLNLVGSRFSLVVASGGCSPAAECRLFILEASLVAQTLGLWISSFSPLGLVALQHVGSSWTRDQAHVPFIGSWILIHHTPREVHAFP